MATTAGMDACENEEKQSRKGKTLHQAKTSQTNIIVMQKKKPTNSRIPTPNKPTTATNTVNTKITTANENRIQSTPPTRIALPY